MITAGSTEFSGTIAGTGSGGIEIAGGTQTLSGVNTYAGVTQIDPGATLALKGNGSIANMLLCGFPRRRHARYFANQERRQRQWPV